jgi:hypothetical protein
MRIEFSRSFADHSVNFTGFMLVFMGVKLKQNGPKRGPWRTAGLTCQEQDRRVGRVKGHFVRGLGQVWRLSNVCGLVLVFVLAHLGRAVAAETRVRDRLWIWAHDAKAYDNGWGLPRNGRITPVEGAHYLGVPNIIMIRYEGKPAPPFEQYAVPFKSLKRVIWSIAGAGGATSDEEREHVFRLATDLPNMTGVFMDDFFNLSAAGRPQWLANNSPQFPVHLEVELPQEVLVTAMTLTQSDWASGDYRSGDFVVETTADDGPWRLASKGSLPNAAGAEIKVKLGTSAMRRLRASILNTHDKAGAKSCGLSRIQLWSGDKPISLRGAQISATSSYPGHEPTLLKEGELAEAPAALSVQQLKGVRERLVVEGRRLDLGVTLYTHQLTPRIRSHLEYCDVISLWTWEAKDLTDLEENFTRLKTLASNKRVLLGCYMWDFGARKPMSITDMKKQCEFGLTQLRRKEIEGMIFLASNICDLGLETVEWTRAWISEVGDQAL